MRPIKVIRTGADTTALGEFANADGLEWGGGAAIPSSDDVSLIVHTHTFAEITAKPTTLVGYGITDAAPLVHTHDAADLTVGTLPTGRLTGSYTGITGVGVLTVGTWQGAAIADTYLAALSASKLTGAALPAGIVSSSLTSVGTLTSLTVGGTSTFNDMLTVTSTTKLNNQNLTFFRSGGYQFMNVTNETLAIQFDGSNVAYVSALGFQLAPIVLGTETLTTFTFNRDVGDVIIWKKNSGGTIFWRTSTDGEYMQMFNNGNVQVSGTTTDQGYRFYVGGTLRVSGIASLADVKYERALVALGGGVAPTLGTIGGSGPVTAAQNSWLQVIDSTGANVWLPAWK